MTFHVALISQKGGVGKSTLARLLARELAANDMTVKIADMDTKQLTATEWAAIRMTEGAAPIVRCEPFPNVRAALADGDAYDVLIFDGRPNATRETLDIARAADLIVIPTAQTRDDLHPAVSIANALDRRGIEPERIVFALVKVSSDAEVAAARQYLTMTRFDTLAGQIPVKTAYGQAQDIGLALTETKYPTLNQAAAELAQSIITRLGEVAQVAAV